MAQQETSQPKNREFWKIQFRIATDDIVQDSKLLAPADRAIVWARLAAISWQVDPPRSTKWLREAVGLVDVVPEVESVEEHRRRLSSLRLLLSISAPLDERSTSQIRELLSSSESKSSKEDLTQNANALVQAALGLVESDPARAASLGAASLRVGRSNSFGSLVTRLRAKNEQLGDALFKEALAISDTSLLASLTIIAFNSSPPMSEIRRSSVIAVSRQFLGSEASSSPSRGCALATAVVPLLEWFDKEDPQAANIVRGGLIQCKGANSSNAKPTNDQPLKTVDDLLEAANKASNTDERVQYLSQAVYLASGEKNFIRAIQILDSFTEEERVHLGESWDNWRWEFAASGAIACLKQADRIGMEKMIASTPTKLRAFVQLLVAEELANSGDRPGGMELLEASRKSFKSDDRDLFDWYLSLLRRVVKIELTEAPGVFREFVSNINRSAKSTNSSTTGTDTFLPLDLPAALVEPDVAGIFQLTSEIEPRSIRIKTRLGLLKVLLPLSQASKKANPPKSNF